MGIGWKLNGLSAIVRCAKTRQLDGIQRPVKIDSDDRLCLDSERLVPFDGSYWGPTTTYKSLTESFSRVTATKLNGYDAFIVRDRDGKTSTFGGSPDSVRTVSGSTGLSWHLSKVEDAYGNYLSISYEKDEVLGDIRPSRILYTGNVRASRAPSVTVTFAYEDRPDPVTAFVGGRELQINKRLSRVAVAHSSGGKYYYAFQYKSSAASGRSLLSSINRCVSDNACLDPITFLFGDVASEPVKEWSPVGPSDAPADLKKPGLKCAVLLPADLNRDGRDDALCLIDVGMSPAAFAALASDKGFESWKPWGGTITAPERLTLSTCDKRAIGDLNGDGNIDFACLNSRGKPGPAAEVWIAFGSRTGLETWRKWTEVPQTAVASNAGHSGCAWFSMADMDGDGRSDLVCLNAGSPGTTGADPAPDRLVYSLSGGDKPGAWQELLLPSGPDDRPNLGRCFANGSVGLILLDVDGDGRREVICHESTLPPPGCESCLDFLTTRTWIGRLDGAAQPWTLVHTQSSVDPASLRMDACRSTSIVDVNGDGVLDILCLENTANPKAFVQLGSGVGLRPWTLWSTLPAEVDATQCTVLHLIDVTRDGVADVVCVTINTTNSRVSVSAGSATGFRAWTYPTAPIPIGDYARCGMLSPSDLFGAVPVSMLCMNTAEAQFPSGRHVRLSAGTDLLTAVTNGYGPLAEFEFKGLGSGIYEASTSTYPILDVANAGLVLSEVRTNDGIGGWRTTTYSYSGLRVDLLSEGSLGFRHVVTREPQNDIAVKTTYGQGFPFTGLTVEKVSTVGGVTTDIASTTWDILVFTRHCEERDAAGSWIATTRDGQSAADREKACSASAVSGKPTRFVLKADSDSKAAVLAGKNRPEEGLQASYMTYPVREIGETFDIAGTRLGRHTTKHVVDALGNLTGTTREDSDGRRTEASTLYEIDQGVGIFGRPVQKTVMASRGGQSDQRSTEFVYDMAGQVHQEVVASGTAVALTKVYLRDDAGNVTSVEEKAAGGLSRTQHFTFDANRTFTTRTVNFVGHIETMETDPMLGVRLSRIDHSGKRWSWEYDQAGREIAETNPRGLRRTARFTNCASAVVSCPKNAAYLVYRQTPGQADSYSFHDALGREIGSAIRAPGGAWQVSGTEFDGAGRVKTKFEPAHLSHPHGYRRYAYDGLGRPIEVSTDEGVSRRYAYSGLSTVVSDALGAMETLYLNARGHTVARSTKLGQTVTIDHDVWDNISTVSLGSIAVVANTYDALGRLVTVSSPDRGTVTYARDGFGRVVEERTSLTSTQFSYDLLDRLLQRTNGDATFHWKYDESPNARGLLSRVLGSEGSGEELAYDANGQVAQRIKVIGGQRFTFSYEYSPSGQLLSTTYPDGFVVRNVYDAYGYLRAQREKNGALLTEVLQVTPRGQVAEILFGNSLNNSFTFEDGGRRLHAVQTTRGPNKEVVFGLRYKHENGLLMQQDDLALNLTERFSYDEMRRLRLSDVLGGETVESNFDSFGRIVEKSGVAKIDYDTTRFSFSPSAVGGREIKRDANGRQTDWQNGTAQLGWHGKPERMERAGYRVVFQYDHNLELVREVVSHQGALPIGSFPLKDPGVTVRAGGLFEKRNLKDREITYNFLPGPAGLYGAIVFVKDKASGTTRRYVRYFHRDRVGSVVAISGDGGALVERRRYDAWGKARPIPQQGVAISPPIPIDQSFGGHMAMRDFGLVYAGGRLYDPALGMFTAPDQISALGGAFHEYNYYSYGGSNPLSAVDPTGMLSFGEFIGGVAGFAMGGPIGGILGIGLVREAEKNETLRTAITIGVAVAITVATNGAATGAAQAMLTGMAAGAGAGATYTTLSGGTFNDALGAAAIGGAVGAFSGLGGYGIAQGAGVVSASAGGGAGGQFAASSFTVAGQGVMGGLTTEALGGDFKHGFEQSAFFAAVSEAGSAVYRGSIQRGDGESSSGAMPDGWAHGEQGRPRLSDLPTAPASRLKLLNEDGVAMLNGKGQYLTNNWGQAQKVGGWFVEGGAFSRSISMVPGMNPAAYLHDSWMKLYPGFSTLGLNAFETSKYFGWLPSVGLTASMLPAGIVTYSAMAHEIHTIQSQAVWGCRYSRTHGGGTKC